MRAAPPVTAVLNHGRPERMLITGLHLLAGALLAAWGALHAEWPPAGLAVASGAGALAMAPLGRWLGRRALTLPAGHLHWTGQAWQWAHGAHGPDSTPRPLARVVLALDLGGWVLLRLHPADGARPLWRTASVGTSMGAWHGLRLALASHAGAPPAADAGGAVP